jgi:SAM-dependent methyltransferase
MRSLVHKLGRAYQEVTLRSIAETQSFRKHNERPQEFAFVFRAIGKLAPRSILDVGTGTTALPAMMASCGAVVTAIDNVTDYWPAGMVNRHWHVIDDDIQRTKLSKVFDMVTCISTLEHIKDYNAAVHNVMRLLRPGGCFVLTCPYTDREFVEDAYRAAGADPEMARLPYICRSYSRAQLDEWLRGGAELVEAEYWRGWTGRHWATGSRIAPPEPSSREGDHNHACFLIRRTP